MFLHNLYTLIEFQLLVQVRFVHSIQLAADIRSKGESPFFISPAATAFNNLATVLPLPLDSTEMYLISSMMMTAASPQV